jgi:UDP-N-acetylmuramyl pentapeptide synthase
VATYDTPEEALDDVLRSATPDDLILFKGSRVAGLEMVAESLR